MSVTEDIDAGIASTIFVVLVVVAILLYVMWKKISIASWLYSIWASIASFIDQAFAGSPISGGTIQHSVDHGLGGVASWLSGMEPAPNPSPASTDQTYPGDNVDLNAGLNANGSANWGTQL